MLNWSVDFGLARWDRLAIFPAMTARPAAGPMQRTRIAEQVIRGADCDHLDRKPGDPRTPEEILRHWLRGQAQRIP